MAVNLKDEAEVKKYLTNLGIEYRFGCYSEKDPEVCHLLGDYLDSVDKDFAKASKVYKANCDEHSYAKSCYKFATSSLLGRGCKQSYKNAYDYFERGCNLNNPESCLHQGLLLTSKSNDTEIASDVLKGMTLLEKACLADNPNACYYLSGMYIAGVRKENPKTQDVDKLRKTDDLYEVKKNMPKAFEYALHGCNLGNIYSCVNLSQMYSRGDGVQKNPELAEKYRNIALEMQSQMTSQKTLTFGQGLDN